MCNRHDAIGEKCGEDCERAAGGDRGEPADGRDEVEASKHDRKPDPEHTHAICGAEDHTGTVRGDDDGADITALTLEHFPGMTESEITSIIETASERWSLVGVTVIHRVGRLLPEDNIVFVGVAAAHREAAFASASFIMDYLKTRAPFWKKAEDVSGESWVEARASDDMAADRWDKTD